ncbi:MAG TPA: hypothetical protein VN253_11150 [Kofleriaceae bacterium]|nr:hypothetical protein [Kofleriaceae bacterium]
MTGVLGEPAIAAVMHATGSRWCGPRGPGAAAVVAIGVARVRAEARGAVLAAVLELAFGTPELGFRPHDAPPAWCCASGVGC